MKFQPKPHSIIAVDMDGTLCENEGFTEQDCIDAKPKMDMISKINELHHKGCFIIIYTARRSFLRAVTEYWLEKYEVEYNIIDVGHKVWADYYIDDRNILINDL